MKFHFFLFSTVLLGLTSCKKEKEQPLVPAPANHIELTIVRNFTIVNCNPVLESITPQIIAYRYSTHQNWQNNAGIDSAFCNGVRLHLVNDGNITFNYGDTLQINTALPVSYALYSKTPFPSLFLNSSSSFIDFTKSAILPDSISRTNQTIIELEDRSNQYSCFARIDKGIPNIPNGHVGIKYFQPIIDQTTPMKFSIDPDNAFFTNSKFYLIVEINQLERKTIDDSYIYIFEKSIYRKEVYLKD
ncbi:MAG: hypothetical protein AB7O73_11465 [Bacteroidia bacterium]